MTTQSYFLDIDLDGDLDAFLLNIPRPNVYKPSPLRHNYGDSFYENLGIDFSNRRVISKKFAFGLGIAASDFDNNGEFDLYFSNDYDEGDFYFSNASKDFKNNIKN